MTLDSQSADLTEYRQTPSEPATAQAACPGAKAAPWYVCVTNRRKEPYVALNMQEQGCEFHLPMLVSLTRKSDV